MGREMPACRRQGVRAADLNYFGLESSREKEVPIRNNLEHLKEIFSDLLSSEKDTFDRRFIFGLLLFAFLLRIPLLIYPEVIHNDGTEYIRYAKQILAGDWTVGKSHPFYPLLIAFAHFFSPNDEIAGIWVSVILGSLLVFPVFYLGKAIFSEKVGILSALFAAVHPFLYISSGSVLTESTFHLLLATSVLFGWIAFDKGRFFDILLFSLFTSFCYLTRPEGIGFLLIFGLWVLLVHPVNGQRRWIKRFGMIFVAIFSFLIFSSPYLIQIKRETGRWQISKKVSVSMGSLSEEEAGVPIEMIKVKKEISFSSLLKSPLTVVKKMGIGFLQSLYKFQQVYTPLLSLLLILGFLLTKGRHLSLKGNLYLVSYFVYFFAFIHPFFWVTRRYTSHVISLSLPWAALGFLEVIHWVRKRFEKERFQRKFPALLLIVVLIGLFVQGRVIHPREHRVIQREVGLWMKDNLPRGVKVMSQLPQEAFYAELPWIRMPSGSYEEILKAARSKEVQYIIIDENIEKESPDFLKKSKAGDLIQLRNWVRKDQWMKVFEIIYP
jgi:4-amino-4-deoxy-L-arabinose transferase-like glycosyltransferase